MASQRGRRTGLTTNTDDGFRPPPAPFGGWVKNNKGVLVPAATGPHILASAPPGTGKTRKWLSVAAAMWPCIGAGVQ